MVRGSRARNHNAHRKVQTAAGVCSDTLATPAARLRRALLLHSTPRTSTPDIGEQPNDEARRCVRLRPPPKIQERPIHRSFGGCHVAA